MHLARISTGVYIQVHIRAGVEYFPVSEKRIFAETYVRNGSWFSLMIAKFFVKHRVARES
jgi:hypothetical protein